jgi:hypothetical protein
LLEKSRAKENNREIYREFFDFLCKIPDLCPNSAILLLEQGINSEFSNLPPKSLKSKGLIEEQWISAT